MVPTDVSGYARERLKATAGFVKKKSRRKEVKVDAKPVALQ
jgi:hypothetical protein